MRYIKSLRIMAAALTIALLAATLPATPALAAALLYTDPTRGKINDSISVFGYGFTPGVTVNIYFSSDNAQVNDYFDVMVTAYELVATANSSGNQGEIDTDFIVPERLTDGYESERVSNGNYYIYATYTTGNKEIRATANFTVVNVSDVTLSQNKGAVNTNVEITGNGFGSNETITVKYDGNKVRITSGAQAADKDGWFISTIIIPQSIAGKHTITVTGDNSNFQASAEFTVEARITIIPASGVAGDKVTVIGTGFGRSASLSVSFDGAKVITGATTGEDGSFEVSFNAPSMGAGSHYVEAQDGGGNLDIVTFALAPASITVNPKDGYVGTQITVSGTGFQAVKPVLINFDNDLVTTIFTDAYGRFTASFNVPFRVVGFYNVKVSDGINTVTSIFSIIVSTSISPITSAASPGHVGNELTVSGAGFTVDGIVAITYDGNQIATATADTNGFFSTTFKAPASAAGKHVIIATDGRNAKQVEFFMESTPPPIPVLLKPEIGVKAAAEVYFEWGNVTDSSGMTYSLQIATDKNFSQGSIVLEKNWLTTSEYTLAGGERLKSVSKNNPYYWHVKAVDGAFNEGQWSDSGSFYVGFSIETQQLIYIIIGIGVLLLGLFGYWLGTRKTPRTASG